MVRFTYNSFWSIDTDSAAVISRWSRHSHDRRLLRQWFRSEPSHSEIFHIGWNKDYEFKCLRWYCWVGEQESTQQMWENSQWTKLEKSRGKMQERGNSFVGYRSRNVSVDPVQGKPLAVVRLHHFSPQIDGCDSWFDGPLGDRRSLLHWRSSSRRSREERVQMCSNIQYLGLSFDFFGSRRSCRGIRCDGPIQRPGRRHRGQHQPDRRSIRSFAIPYRCVNSWGWDRRGARWSPVRAARIAIERPGRVRGPTKQIFDGREGPIRWRPGSQAEDVSIDPRCARVRGFFL